MKLENVLLSGILMVFGLCVVAPDGVAQTGNEIKLGDLLYDVTQMEENPMWLEILAHGDYQTLESVTIPDEIMVEDYSWSGDPRPAVVEKIGDSAFSFCGLRSIKIPSSVKRIGKNAFSSCHLESVTFSEGLVSIGEKAFSKNFMLETVKLPESLRFMEYACFSFCESLSEVYLPSGLISMGGFTFRYCGCLQNIYCYAEVPPVASDSDFGMVYNKDYFEIDMPGGPDLNECVLHVPAGSEELYRNAPGWNLFKKIVAIDGIETEVPGIEAANNFTYEIAEGVLTIQCKAHDTVCIYDAAGVCLEKAEITLPGEFRYCGSGIRIVGVNGKTIKVTL